MELHARVAADIKQLSERKIRVWNTARTGEGRDAAAAVDRAMVASAVAKPQSRKQKASGLYGLADHRHRFGNPVRILNACSTDESDCLQRVFASSRKSHSIRAEGVSRAMPAGPSTLVEKQTRARRPISTRVRASFPEPAPGRGRGQSLRRRSTAGVRPSRFPLQSSRSDPIFVFRPKFLEPRNLPTLRITR
jgi:hypothetical protein